MKVRVMMFALTMLLISPAGIFAAEPQPVDGQSETMDGTQGQGKEKAKFCPVCGPEEEMEGLAFSYKYEGKKYAFCSMDCMKEFKKNPEKFIKTGQSEVEPKN